MIFMAVDPGLEPYARADLREMESVGSNADLNIVVQRETPADVERFYVRQGSHQSCQDGENSPPTGAGGVRALLDWGRQVFPAQHQALILWGHSRGIAETLEAAPEDLKAPAAQTHVWLPRVTDLAQAIPAKLDLIGFDSCFLGSIEAAYQLRHAAE